MIGVRYGLALIPKGAMLFSDLDFKVGNTSGFIRLNSENYVIVWTQIANCLK